MKNVRHPLALAVLLALSGQAVAADAPVDIERLTILGSKQAVNDLPGSGYYMSEEELAEFEFTDIHRALGKVPGVYVLEEDGYGLRPNIGMRGTGVSRSDKITVMEDNVIAAPAPYASPAAYYFPTFGRMQALEVIKGSSSVAYGPRTTGGVLNLVSRGVPDAPIAGALMWPAVVTVMARRTAGLVAWVSVLVVFLKYSAIRPMALKSYQLAPTLVFIRTT